MPLISPSTLLVLVDAIAVVLSQAYQTARARLALASSSVLRLACQRDHALSKTELLRRELAILRAQRESMSPHRRPDYEPAQRAQGRSSWGLRSLIGLSLNGLTAFSVAPLRMATVLGLLLALIALIYGGKIIYETVVYGASVPGYPSLFVGVMVLGAVQLVMLGVVGEYIGKILYEIKARPVYFVAEHDVKLREEVSKPKSDTKSDTRSDTKSDTRSDAQSDTRTAAE